MHFQCFVIPPNVVLVASYVLVLGFRVPSIPDNTTQVKETIPLLKWKPSLLSAQWNILLTSSVDTYQKCRSAHDSIKRVNTPIIHIYTEAFTHH